MSRARAGRAIPWTGLLDLDRGVEHVQDLLPAGHRLLGHVQDLGELGHRLEEDRDQEGEGDQGPDGQAALGADGHPDQEHGRGGQDAEQLAGGEEEGTDGAGPDLGPAAAVDRAHHPALGLVLDAVGADHGRPLDRLGDGGQRLPDPGPDQVPGRHHPALHDPEHDRQGQHGGHRDQGQAPVVDDHGHQRGQHQGAVDDPGQPAPAEELAEGLHVRGDPGDQGAALLLGVVGHAEGVDVVEGPHPQAAQGPLAGRGQPLVGGPGRPGRDQDQRHPGSGQDQHPREVGVAADDVAVDGLLDQHRGHHPPASGDQGQGQGDGGPLAQLGRGGKAPPQQPQGRDLLGLDLAPVPHRRSASSGGAASACS